MFGLIDHSSVPRAISMPFALLYIKNKLEHAICCRLSCCSYVVTQIRVLPEEPTTLECACPISSVTTSP